MHFFLLSIWRVYRAAGATAKAEQIEKQNCVCSYMRGPVRYCIYILNRYQKELAPDQVSVATMHTTSCYGGGEQGTSKHKQI